MKYNTTVSAAPTNKSSPGSSEYLENILLFQMIVLGTLAVLGVAGNMTILVTGLRRVLCASDLRSRQEYRTSFITSLAVADILILVYGVPLHLSQANHVPMNETVCRYLVPLRDVFALISILTIMAISVERAVAIINPFCLGSTQQYAKYWIVVIWITGYLLAGLPMVFVMTVYPNGPHCMPQWRNARVKRAHLWSAVLLIIIPGITTTLCYSFCLRSLCRFRQRRMSNNESTGIQQWSFIKQTRSVSRIAVVLVVVFWLCNLPLVIYAICMQEQLLVPTPEAHAYTWAVLICLFFGASVINPLVLIAMSPLYRKSAASCVHFIFSRQNGIFRLNSRGDYSKTSETTLNKSEHVSIANNEYEGGNNPYGMPLTSRKQSAERNNFE